MPVYAVRTVGMEYARAIAGQRVAVADLPIMRFEVSVELNGGEPTKPAVVSEFRSVAERRELMDDRPLNKKRVPRPLPSPQFVDNGATHVGAYLVSTRKLVAEVWITLQRILRAGGNRAEGMFDAIPAYFLQAEVGLRYEYRYDREIWRLADGAWGYSALQQDPLDWQPSEFDLSPGPRVPLVELTKNAAPVRVPIGTRMGVTEEAAAPIVRKIKLPLGLEATDDEG